VITITPKTKKEGAMKKKPLVQDDMRIIYAIFACPMIREGFDK
jgi:hypothetical protein